MLTTKHGQGNFKQQTGQFLIVRWETGKRVESYAYPVKFDSNRANEILQSCPIGGDLYRRMSDEEIAYTKMIWNKMPGYTCFNDALVRIAKARAGEHPKAKCVRMPNGDHGLEGYSLNEFYRYSVHLRDKHGKPYYRVYPGDDEESTYYETCSPQAFHKHFEISNEISSDRRIQK